MSEDTGAPDIAQPEEILTVKSPEELADLIFRSLMGLKETGLKDLDDASFSASISFLAGTLSALQIQQMQMIGYIEHLTNWCNAATMMHRKMNAKFGAPWPFGVWLALQAAPNEEARQEIKMKYWEAMGKEQPKIITLS